MSVEICNKRNIVPVFDEQLLPGTLVKLEESYDQRRRGLLVAVENDHYHVLWDKSPDWTIFNMKMIVTKIIAETRELKLSWVAEEL